jgi:hypothetical protein
MSKQALRNRLTIYQGAVNEIDDYFEYRNESKKDRKKVHEILKRLTENLVDEHARRIK